MKKILLIGAGGLVGQALVRAPHPADWDFVALTRAQLDITDRHALRYAFDQHQPELVINAAALSSVDEAEKNETRAYQVNFNAVAALAGLCAAYDSRLIHLSTNYVFDGQSTTPYTTENPMNPINIYGKSKVLGEEAVRETLAFHVIVRLSSVFGLGRPNLLTNTVQTIASSPVLRMPHDQILAPTDVRVVAEDLIAIADAQMNGKGDGFGTFHLTGTPALSRHDFVRTVMDLCKADPTFPQPPLESIAYGDRKDLSPRPLYVAMDTSKLERVYGLDSKDWRPALAAYCAAYLREKQASNKPVP